MIINILPCVKAQYIIINTKEYFFHCNMMFSNLKYFRQFCLNSTSKNHHFLQTPMLTAASSSSSTVRSSIIQNFTTFISFIFIYIIFIILQDGETPLIWAIRNGQSEVVDKLLKKGANIETKNKVGKSQTVVMIVT